jgi:2'-5' RNA ligase
MRAVYSLNVPVPGRVERIATALHPRLVAFERVRERRSLVVKRFESDEYGRDDYHRLAERVHRVLAGSPAFEARVAGIDCFEEPVRGPGPVVYLAVESAELSALHHRLVDAFGAIAALEGAAYVPHVTLARGGSVERAQALASREIDSVAWTVSELQLWDATHREVAGTVSLPAR